MRNEAETCADLINPQLAASGWGVVPGTRIRREHPITQGRLQSSGRRTRPLKADYILEFNGQKLAVIEAKQESLPVGEGVAQAKEYAAKMDIRLTFASNGRSIYQIDMAEGTEGLVAQFPTPEQLWQKTFATPNPWLDSFNGIPFEDVGGSKQARYYQETAVNKVMTAIADGKNRILLTLATGTGKTFIAFQIAWKLFYTRWNVRDQHAGQVGSRRPRILFLADRNILADQAFNAFNAFPEDALVRIRPEEISKKGRVPTNGSIFFTIFQTFMSGGQQTSEVSSNSLPSLTSEVLNATPYFGDYPADFFDFIIIDECHRGGANDESSWRAILDYFETAVQLGLTATPKRKDNVDTYAYFGDPVYIYSLKEGINDGFLTPFKVKRIQTTIDEYIYTDDDIIIEGDVEKGKQYTESDFNRTIEIKERERARVRLFLDQANPRDKSLVFCATQAHAALIRDLINQESPSTAYNYCVRVTANDGALGEQYLRDFQDNEKTLPTILTTSQKLSTGVDARNVRNIVLLRLVNSMIEFKQIVGRGTRLFEGKAFFTLYDFVGAHHHFQDPEWDGEPLDNGKNDPPILKEKPKTPYNVEGGDEDETESRTKLRIKLSDGKVREIEHMTQTSYWSADGTPISAQQFMQNLLGELPAFFNTEAELREMWANPITRAALLQKLEGVGYGRDELRMMQRLIDAENSDLLDVLEYVQFTTPPISRAERVSQAHSRIFDLLNDEQRLFLEFVLAKYIETGVEELAQEKLPELLILKYQALDDAQRKLGDVATIRSTFVDFQRYLYA
ncbi:MAG: DEAD/DEAH box helicase family protein [Anaerolineaceae bacterium]|nr:DEAD/DEAH box helicase family protein [Anaerolineaceae bacterium]